MHWPQRIVALALLPSVLNAQTTLNASDASAHDWFGTSVDVDGATLVAGAMQHDDGGTNAGAAYVFELAGGAWTERALLVAPDAEAWDNFGFAVALDGTRLIAGARSEGALGLAFGAAYVYDRVGSTWTYSTKLIAPDREDGDLFGSAVALDGDTALIGSHGDPALGSLTGAAHVFVRSSGVWTHQARLTGADTGWNDAFGWSVALDGDTAVIGAVNKNAAYVFVRSGSTWTEQAKLLPDVAAQYPRFGYAVALQGDTAVVGAIDGGGYPNPGSVYVFERSGAVWTETAHLYANGAGAYASFGTSVAIDGDHLAGGAPLELVGQPAQGAVHLFERSGSTWIEETRVISPTPANDDGFAMVALSAGFMVVGEMRDDVGAANTGSVHVFDYVAVASYCTAGTSAEGCVALVTGNGHPSASSGTGFALDLAGAPAQRSCIYFYGVNGRAALTWDAGSSSVLCLAPPYQRMPLMTTSGTAGLCDGAASMDWNAYAASNPGALGQPFAAGAVVGAQAWYRDPPNPKSSSLSDAVEFVVGP